MKTRNNTLLKTIFVLFITALGISCGSNDPDPAPTITTISPTSGPQNTIVTISGSDFGTDISNVQVFFNDVEATVQAVTNTQITAIVPPKAFTGEVTVISNGKTIVGPVFTYINSGIQVSTLAGSTLGSVDGTGSNAQFIFPAGVAVDAQGNVYVADIGDSKIRKITPSGAVSTLAGSTEGFADGTGSSAQFDNPIGVAVDAQGNVYVADANNNKIRKVTPSGVVTTLAGSTLGFADGTGSSAQFSGPAGVTVDAQGNVYVADANNNKIRKVTPSGVVTTLAGSTLGFADGTGSDAQFILPTGVAVDAQGNVYVAEWQNNKIRKVTPSGVVSTLAGSTEGFADGTGSSAQFRSPTGVAVDAQGNVYVADRNNHKIRKITPNGAVSTLAGSTGGFADGTGSTVRFDNPYGVTVDAQGNVYVADMSNHKIRKITQ